jgi:hypothetical protein
MLGAVPPFARNSSITLSFQLLISPRAPRRSRKSTVVNRRADRTLPAIAHDEALAWAQWIDDGNRRDVEAVLAHFADDGEFCSPLVVSVNG